MSLFRNNNAEFTVPTLTSTKTTVKVTGSITWFKDGEWGIAYKASSATAWNYIAKEAMSFSAESVSGLTAGTSYDVCFYVKFDGAYQRGTSATIKTTA